MGQSCIVHDEEQGGMVIRSETSDSGFSVQMMSFFPF
jgi:hypothetical protein